MNGHSRAIVAYNFLNDSFLKQLKFGARYADREQDIKYTTYNWGSLSEVWGGAGPQGAVPYSWTRSECLQERRQLLQLEQFLQGQHNAPPPALYYSGNLVDDYQQAIDFAQLRPGAVERAAAADRRLGSARQPAVRH